MNVYAKIAHSGAIPRRGLATPSNKAAPLFVVYFMHDANIAFSCFSGGNLLLGCPATVSGAFDNQIAHLSLT